jgi:hypothetical protein
VCRPKPEPDQHQRQPDDANNDENAAAHVPVMGIDKPDR